MATSLVEKTRTAVSVAMVDETQHRGASEQCLRCCRLEAQVRGMKAHIEALESLLFAQTAAPSTPPGAQSSRQAVTPKA